jgi:hypothetical protein
MGGIDRAVGLVWGGSEGQSVRGEVKWGRGQDWLAGTAEKGTGDWGRRRARLGDSVERILRIDDVRLETVRRRGRSGRLLTVKAGVAFVPPPPSLVDHE